MSLEGFNYFLNNGYGLNSVAEISYDRVPDVALDFSGTGIFTNNHVPVSGSGIYSTDWAMFFVFEKTGRNNGIIFSNYQNQHGEISGFAVGVNMANKLYVETYDENGPAIYQSNVYLASKNAISVSKIGTNISLDYFNFNAKTTENNSFTVSDKAFAQSDSWFVGGAPNAPSYFAGDNFQGSIENFIYLTGSFQPYQIDALFLGLSLERAPKLYHTIIDESCEYDYLGLTGNISGITFTNIDTMSYYVQTGLLLDKTGTIEAKITGTIVSGTGTASGRITGFVNSGSGYDNTQYIPYSGVTGQETIVNGLRMFESLIPTGGSGAYFLYPDNFSGTPLVFTEVYTPTGFVGHQVSGITNSGFFVSFTHNIVNTGTILTTLAAPAQDNPSFKIGQAQILPDIHTQFIPFPSDFTGTPKVYCTLENNVETLALEYYIAETFSSGFNLTFTNTTTTENYKINYLATDLVQESSFQVKEAALTSGITQQFIPFNTTFAEPPLILAQLVNLSGEQLYSHKILERTSGFDIFFSNPLASNNYRLNVLAWSGAESRVQYLNVNTSGFMYLGQATDESKNVYNLSGYGVSTQTIPYDLAITRTVIRSGITVIPDSGIEVLIVPINIPVNYTIELLTGQAANFIHTIYYDNPGTNFLTTNHTLYYNSSAIQETPFYVYKYCSQYMGLRLEDYLYNTGYIHGFGMDGVSYIGEYNYDDHSELIVFPYSHNKTNINKNATINRTNGYYILDNVYTPHQVSIYENGIGLFGSGYSVTGNLNPGVVLSGDYGLSGYNAIPLNVLEDNDDIIYDTIPDSKNYYKLPQSYIPKSGNLYLNSFDTFNRDLYLNGVKLSSGLDYFRETVDNMDLIRIANSGLTTISGKMFTLPFGYEPKIKYTGVFNSVQTQRFARGTSMLWANGIRQKLGEDYLEIANVSLLTGTRSTITHISPVFNNDETFWE